MTDLDALDRFDIDGRGPAFVVASPVTFDRRKPALLGEVVRIAGETWRVKGVETFLGRATISAGDKISLLVEPC